MRRLTGLIAASSLAALCAPPGCGGGRGGATTGTPDPEAPPPPPPAWRDVAPLGKAPLELPGALIPRGADAILPVPGAVPAVYALKRDFNASALYHVEFASPAAPTVGVPLVLRGPTSEPAIVGDALVIGALEAGRPPEALVVRGGSPPRVVARARFDDPFLGPVAVRGDMIYFATAAVEGLPETAAPSLVAVRLVEGAAGTALEVVAGLPLPAPAHGLATAGDRLLASLAATPPLRAWPLRPDGTPAGAGSGVEYRIVQKLTYGEYAFEAAPRALAELTPTLVLAADPHTTFVPVVVEEPPRIAYDPPFHHSRGGGILAVDHSASGAASAADGPGASSDVLYRLRVRRVFVDALGADARPTAVARWRLEMLGSGRALALLPALLVAADDAFGLYLFPR